MRVVGALVAVVAGAAALAGCSRGGPEPLATYAYPTAAVSGEITGTEADDLGRCVASALRIDGGSAVSATVWRTTFEQAARVIPVVDPEQERGPAYVVQLTGTFDTAYPQLTVNGVTQSPGPSTDYWIVASDPVLPDPSGFWCSDADTGPQLAVPERLGLLGTPLALPASAWTVPEGESDPGPPSP